MYLGDFDRSRAALSAQHLGMGLSRRRVFAWAAVVVFAGSAQAIDNPDAPDRKAEFLTRAQPHEDRLAAASGGPALAAAADAYAKFLDAELNQVYLELLAQLGAEARQALTLSQRQWLRFREAETRFVDRNWTPKNFGSSSVLSRAGYRAHLVKQRVLTLLAYLQNYPVSRHSFR